MDKSNTALGRAHTFQSSSDYNLDENPTFQKRGQGMSLDSSLVSQPVQKASRNSKLDVSADGACQQMQHLRFTRRLMKMWKSNRNFREKKGVTNVERDFERKVKTQQINFEPLRQGNTIQIGNFQIDRTKTTKVRAKQFSFPDIKTILAQKAKEEKSEPDASITQLSPAIMEQENLKPETGPIAAIQLQPEEDDMEEVTETPIQQNEEQQLPIGKPLFLRATTQSAFLVMEGSDKENVMNLRHLKDYKGCIVLPDDGWFVIWSIFLIIMIIFSGIFTPLRVAFLEEQPISMGVEWFLDAVFLVDTVLNFVTAYFDRGECLIDNRRQIACNYLKSWFVVDLISVLPLKVFLSHSVTQMAKIARVHRVDRLIRTFNLLRMMKSGGTRSRAEMKHSEQSFSSDYQGLVFYFMIFIILCHNLACLWFWIAKLQGFGPTTWVTRFDLGESRPTTQYISAFYFIIETITTVGYGDFNAATEIEMLFCCVLMLIGVIAYSMSISALSSIISTQDQKAQKLKSRLSVLDRVRRQFGLKFEFYWRLRQSLHYDVDKDMTDKQQLLGQLPNKLRVQLSTLMYREQLAGIHYFRKKSPHFIATVAPMLRPVNLSKGDYVYMTGDPLDAVYFIKSGETAYVQSKQKADLVFAVNKAGSFFGDIDFTQSTEDCEAKRAFSVKARTNVELLVLQKQDLFNLDSQFKNQIMQLFSNAVQNFDALNDFVDKANEWYNFSNTERKPMGGITEEDYEEGDDTSSVRGLRSSSGLHHKSESLYNSFKLHKSKAIGELMGSGIFKGKQTPREDWDGGSLNSTKINNNSSNNNNSGKFIKKQNRPSLLKSSCTKRFSNYGDSESKLSETQPIQHADERGNNTSQITELMKEEIKEESQATSIVNPNKALKLKKLKTQARRSSGFLSPTSPHTNKLPQFQFKDITPETQNQVTDERDWEKQRTFLMEVLKNAKKT